MPLEPIYRGPQDPATPDQIERWLASPPPWRDHSAQKLAPRPNLEHHAGAEARGRAYVSTSEEERECVNLALWLRRPLLVTGKPGVGKSSLAYGIAAALGLGAPLRWEINSRSTLQDGLYTYDAVGHFRAVNEAKAGAVLASDFVRLGPLGTAFVPTDKPRVVLVDELDKASWDLPNDLLHVFEEAEFVIPELTRQDEVAEVQLHDSMAPTDRVPVERGRVRARHHPVVVVTSNQEREFSPAFLRRCVQLEMKELSASVLKEVVRAQFKQDLEIPADLVNDDTGGTLPTDVALQTLYLTLRGADLANIRERLTRGR